GRHCLNQKQFSGKDTQMRIAVVGAGAIGQLFGAHLVAGGQTVTLIDSSEDVCDGITQNGIQVRMGNAEFHVLAKAMKAEDCGEVFDLVLIFTKGPHTRSAVESITHLITDQTVGISLQNGLGNETPLAEVFGGAQTIIGMTDFPSDRAEDGVTYSEPTGHVVLGGLTDDAQARAQQVASILDKSGLNATFDPNVMIPIWEKVIFNAVFNMVSGVTGLTVGAVYDVPEARSL